MIVKCLTENTTHKDNIISEHGLSLYLETQKHKILFDMGQTDAFYKNSKEMGVNLKDVDIAVLSHGHYDHSGGLLTFLNINKTAKIYMNKYVFEEHYNGTEKYIGLDKELLRYSDRFIYLDEDLVLDDELTLYQCKNQQKIREAEPFGLNVIYNGKLVPDDFRHEQCLKITENGKSVIISGCSHNGILNIEEWFKPDVLIGGFHFTKIDPINNGDKLKEYSDCLSNYNTKYITCHCTGIDQYNYLKTVFKGDLSYISAGDIYTI